MNVRKETLIGISEISKALRSDNENERWRAAILAGELISSEPKVVWDLVLEHGQSEDEDIRSAVATCMLEHLLEINFDDYFPCLRAEIMSGKMMLGDTLSRCWKFGQSQLPNNSAMWDRLVEFSIERQKKDSPPVQEQYVQEQ